jgi:outer membrane protein assembly factor BamA
MARRATLPLGLLAVICSHVYAAPGGPQSPHTPKRCSVMAASEENASHGKVISVAEVDAPHRKVIIERIQFDGPIHLADTDIAQIIAEANQHDLNADGSGWLEELTEVGLRGTWQDRGYFHVVVTAEAHSLGGDSNAERFLVTAHVNEGLQYHLGDLRFVSDTVALGDTPVPEAELRGVFPLHGGELFSVSMLREGLQILTKLFGSYGFVDFVAVPDITLDDSLQRISLVIRLQQSRQFRVGRVEILGLDPVLEARLRLIVKSGEIYNSEAIYDFYQKNGSVIPFDLSFENSAEILRNVKAGIVDLTFDFRACP